MWMTAVHTVDSEEGKRDGARGMLRKNQASPVPLLMEQT